MLGAEGTGIVLGAIALEQTLRDPNSDVYSLTVGALGVLPFNPLALSLIGIGDLMRTDPDARHLFHGRTTGSSCLTKH